MLVEVEGFDGAGIAERGGDLRGFGREMRTQPLTDTQEFEEIATVIGPEIHGGNFDAGDQVGGVGRKDDFADSFVRELHVDVLNYRFRGAHWTLGSHKALRVRQRVKGP